MILTLGPDNLSTTLDFTVDYPKVGVYMSGGLDSTALLCLIISELLLVNKLYDTPIICFTVDKNDNSASNAALVIDKVKEHFNCEITHVKNVENDKDAKIKGYLGYIAMQAVKNYSTNMKIYMGINRMAPPELKTFKHPLKIDYGTSITTTMYTAPFLFLHKPHIIDILYKLGCEDIIPYTRSCTQVDVGTCGECYACEERIWGFEMLGKTDPSTIII